MNRPVRLVLRDVKDSKCNSSGILHHCVQYEHAKLMPFLVEMEIPVSVAYPIVKKYFEESGLEPGERCLFNLLLTDLLTDQGIMELMQMLLDAAYPDNVCVVDSDGYDGSDINCYVYEVEYDKEYVRKIVEMIRKPEQAPMHLQDKDMLVRTIAEEILKHE